MAHAAMWLGACSFVMPCNAVFLGPVAIILTPITGVLGVIFGITALATRRADKGAAVLGIVLGGIWIVGAGMMLYGHSRPNEVANRGHWGESDRHGRVHAVVPER